MGEFLLTHPNIQMPRKPRYYSVNQGYERYWSREIQELHHDWQTGPLSLRYIGSLVADFHRNLLHGGVFYYPATQGPQDRPHGG